MTDASTVPVHLYVAVLDRIDHRHAEESCEPLLSADERERRDRLLRPRTRREYLYAHALVRFALSQHAPDVPPEAWRFATADGGKPVLAGPPAAPPLQLSLSHTSGVVACAVTTEPLIGVDVEEMNPLVATMDVARRYFSGREVEWLAARDEAGQAEGFFRLWTLKESYCKARGVGLTLPLDQLWFDLSRGGPITIGFGTELADEPGRWRFAERQPTPRHRLAVALAAPMTVVDGAVDRLLPGRAR